MTKITSYEFSCNRTLTERGFATLASRVDGYDKGLTRLTETIQQIARDNTVNTDVALRMFDEFKQFVALPAASAAS